MSMKKTPFDWNRFWTVQLHQVLLGVCAYFISFVILWIIFRIGSPEILQRLNDSMFIYIVLTGLLMGWIFPRVEQILILAYSPLFFLSFGILNMLYYRYWYRKKYMETQRIDFLLPVFLIFILFIAPLLFLLLVKSLSFEPIPTTY